MGSDATEFAPTLNEAIKRQPWLRVVLADAGYDSHANHVLAREELKVRSLIKAHSASSIESQEASAAMKWALGAFGIGWSSIPIMQCAVIRHSDDPCRPAFTQMHARLEAGRDQEGT